MKNRGANDGSQFVYLAAAVAALRGMLPGTIRDRRRLDYQGPLPPRATTFALTAKLVIRRQLLVWLVARFSPPSLA